MIGRARSTAEVDDDMDWMDPGGTSGGLCGGMGNDDSYDDVSNNNNKGQGDNAEIEMGMEI